MHKVLVTGLGGCGVGEGILKALSMKSYEIYGSDINRFFPTMKMVKKSFMLPPATDDNYISNLISICNEYKITAVFPGSEVETKVISENRGELQKNKIFPMINTANIIETFQDSWTTFTTLHSHQFTVPDSCLLEDLENFVDRNDFPLIIKPIFGHGSKHVYIVKNRNHLNFIIDEMNNKKIAFIVQKHIGSEQEEYTVGVFSNKNGEIISSIAMKRTMIAGATLYANIDGYKEIEKYCEHIAKTVNSIGPINFQLRKENNNFYVFEINPRFSGTTPFRAMVGINEPDMMYRNFVLEEDIPQTQYVSNRIIMRMFTEVMIEKD